MSSLATPKICNASSLVGEMMITPVPIKSVELFLHCNSPFTGLNLSVLSISTLGTKKAIVFPLPVLAAPRTSFPARRGGIVLACTSVIVSKPILWIALDVGGDRLSVENGTRS
jgi:hypothetical protein